MTIFPEPFRIALRIEPFVVEITSSIPSMIGSIRHLYADYSRLPLGSDYFADFHIRVDPPKNMRRWFRPQIVFYADGVQPFQPLPFSQAYPQFEWGLNWCIATQVHQYLLIHAAVVEKNGKALILSGDPGAGKSTLCAALVGRGWRLLSDEMAVVDFRSKKLIPVVRPISLKNQSIDLIKNWAPELAMGDAFHDTAKGTVAHVKPPASSVLAGRDLATPTWIVFPRYSAEQASLSVKPVAKGQAVLRLAEQSFNYGVLASKGFNCVCDLVEQCQAFELAYSDLEQALQLFSDWAADD